MLSVQYPEIYFRRARNAWEQPQNDHWRQQWSASTPWERRRQVLGTPVLPPRRWRRDTQCLKSSCGRSPACAPETSGAAEGAIFRNPLLREIPSRIALACRDLAIRRRQVPEAPVLTPHKGRGDTRCLKSPVQASLAPRQGAVAPQRDDFFAVNFREKFRRGSPLLFEI